MKLTENRRNSLVPSLNSGTFIDNENEQASRAIEKFRPANTRERIDNKNFLPGGRLRKKSTNYDVSKGLSMNIINLQDTLGQLRRIIFLLLN